MAVGSAGLGRWQRPEMRAFLDLAAGNRLPVIPMLLLGWTRLSVRTGDVDAARRHLERARELVTSTGYGRREPEVRWLTEQVGPERDQSGA